MHNCKFCIAYWVVFAVFCVVNHAAITVAVLDRNAEDLSSLTAILEDTFERARQFNRENQLGMFKKAKLGNTFKWELKEMGYEAKFVEMATEGLIVYLTRGIT